ncbi:unnamed protein product [Adineta steineri]|uniref:Uncharacterized protein n=2 Tax=Adineta steineri TaxID=433720 RepID=A0A813VVP8_9BILA|nr:unnamed protein product [Adineta steineri]CAF3876314.1 unnamed protein product [Adineta steineri]
MENSGFVREESFVSMNDNQRDVIQAHINMINATADVIVPLTNWRSKFIKLWDNYQWRMRYYFYIHLSIFFLNTLLCGMIVWNIEKHNIPFIDCWFISATCVFTCGLQTYGFSSFSLSSQIVLLIFTLISGITVSTIPAIFIKIYLVKKKQKTIEQVLSSLEMEDNSLHLRHIIRQNLNNNHLNKYIQSLPNPHDLHIKAYIILIVVILSTCITIYLSSFLAIGFYLKYNYDPQDLSQANTTVDPFYASLVITLTGFNQNGLSVWSNGVTLFVVDIFMNIIIMIIVMSGTSLFPAILRGIVDLLKYLVPWRYKIFFDYILLNNHRLSTVIYPSIQTRLYVTITILLQILGVTVALILDLNNTNLSMYENGQRFMIFMFQTVNTRFGGYATINISELSAATLLVFVLLMSIKPQMLCAINETPFEMEWVLLQTQQILENNILDNSRRSSGEIFLPFHRMKHYLLRQGSITKAQAKTYYATMMRTNQAEAAIDEYNGKRYQQRFNTSSINRNNSMREVNDNSTNHNHISLLRMKLHLIIFCRHFILSLFSLITSTRTWLFIAVFLICAFESSKVIPSNPSITVFRIIFEVISAFGGCGLSMGFSNLSPSLAAVLTIPSKIILILVMCMGRHRGLLDSMKDQEEIECNAETLIHSWHQLAIYKYDQENRMNMDKQISTVSITVTAPTPALSTRF